MNVIMRELELVSDTAMNYWFSCLDVVGNGPHMSLVKASPVL